MAIAFRGVSDNNDISVDKDGNKTATRQYIYELSGEDIRKPYLVLGDSNLPSKYAAHPSYPQFKATGERSISNEGDGAKVIVTCSYSSNLLTDVNGNEITEDTPPWEMGLTSWSLTSDIITETPEQDIDGNPIQSSSGSRLLVSRDVSYPVIDLAYSLEDFKAAWIMTYRQSINAQSIVVGGTKLTANQWKMDNLKADRKVMRETNGEVKWSYWDVSIRLIGDPVVYVLENDEGKLVKTKRAWRKVVGDMSIYMKGEKGGFVPIYAYENKKGDYPGGVTGQVVWNSYEGFKKAWGKDKFEEYENSIERLTEPIWLDKNGLPAPIDEKTGYQKTRYKLFGFHEKLDWKPLSMPEKAFGES